MTTISRMFQQRRATMNSRVVRSVNRALVLDLVRERGPISRASLARISSLNKSTVSSTWRPRASVIVFHGCRALASPLPASWTPASLQ